MDLARWVRETVLPTLLVVVGSLVSASPQAAGDQGFDVSRIRAGDLRITSDRCREVPLHVWFTTEADTGRTWEVDFSADVDVRRGSRAVGRTHVSRSMTRPTVATARTTDPYVWCPSLDRLGTFQAGPSRVDAEIYDRDYTLLTDALYRDSTSTSFTVRQGSVVRLSTIRVAHRTHRHRAHGHRAHRAHRAQGHRGHRAHRHRAHRHRAHRHAHTRHARHRHAHRLQAQHRRSPRHAAHRKTRHGHRAALHRLRVAVRYYSVRQSAWRPWRGKQVVVERRSAHGWTRVRVVRTSRSDGVAVVRLPARRGQRFRAVVRGTGTTWGAHSPVRRAR